MENGEKEKRKMDEKEKKLNNKSNISYFEHPFSNLSPLCANLILSSSRLYTLSSNLFLFTFHFLLSVYRLPSAVYHPL